MFPSDLQDAEFLAALPALIAAEAPIVAAQYATLQQGALLMRRMDAPSIVDAVQMEARARIFRRRRSAEARS